ncbi:putative lipase [Dioscorea sansibarensis]
MSLNLKVITWLAKHLLGSHHLAKHLLVVVGPGLAMYHLLVADENYPHIAFVDKGNAQSSREDPISDLEVYKSDLEEDMIRGLTQVNWEHVDVSFQNSRQRYIAHNTIQARVIIF